MAKAYILLGSNIGNRINYLTQVKEQIRKQIGNIYQVSAMYETEPWGYDSSNPFLNQAIVVDTLYPPHILLSKTIEIEKNMGRDKSLQPKNTNSSYLDRIIDIDIIFYDNEIIQTENLQIPHPRMHERQFVLIPMAELASDFIHPVFQKDINTLLNECTDSLKVQPITPKSDIPYQYIAIEGNIGTGKTTLSKLLATKYQTSLIEEQFKENTFLPKFYKNPDKYAFPLELSFLAERYNQLKKALETKDIFKPNIIADYYIAKSLIFSKVTLQADEFSLYTNFFHIIHNTLPKPDLIVYLHKSVPNLQKNIKKRNRSYEQNITDDYLKELEKGYFYYLEKQSDIPIVMINTNDMDYVNSEKDFHTLEQIILKKEYKKGITKVFFN